MIGLIPTSCAAWKNLTAPPSVLWSVSARLVIPSSAAQRHSSAGDAAPSSSEK